MRDWKMVRFPFGIDGGREDTGHNLQSGWGARCGGEFSEYANSVFYVALAPPGTLRGRKAAQSRLTEASWREEQTTQ